MLLTPPSAIGRMFAVHLGQRPLTPPESRWIEHKAGELYLQQERPIQDVLKIDVWEFWIAALQCWLEEGCPEQL